MDEPVLPSLEKIVEQVMEKRLRESDFPAQLSTTTVRQFHEEVHLHYYCPGRKEGLLKGALKSAVRTYLEQQYQYIEEFGENPLKPGKNIIITAHYERK